MSPGTVYYYRCYATNLYGEGYSATVAFTARVQSVAFTGGSYDGYDRKDVLETLRGVDQGVLFTFY